jgi:hypothetical protein
VYVRKKKVLAGREASAPRSSLLGRVGLIREVKEGMGKSATFAVAQIERLNAQVDHLAVAPDRRVCANDWEDEVTQVDRPMTMAELVRNEAAGTTGR